MVDYTTLAPILIEAVKTQQSHIISVEKENVDLKSQNDKMNQDLQSLKSRVEQLESVLARTGSR